MKKAINWKTLSVKELASLISAELKKEGLEAILVGGACATIYSDNRYMSYDLDYVTYDDEDKLAQVLASLGFKRKNKHYSHPECPFVIEFVAPPVAIGHEPIKQFQELRTKFGRVKLLRDVDCVKDRLASFYHWGDKQSLMQAVEVSLNRKVNFREIERWSTKEGFNKKFALFLAAYQKEKNKS